MSLSRRKFLAALAAAGCSAVSRTWGAALSARRPNVLFILADDMGWMDSGAYGSRYYETPSLDRMAANGILFSDAYSASPLCSPTRAAILTGKAPERLAILTADGHLPEDPQATWPHRTGGAAPWKRVIEPQSRRFLPLAEQTIAETFRQAGYATAFVGKWHLGHDPQHWPDRQGFDVNIGGGHWPGPPSYFAPYRISTLPDGPAGEYLTDRLSDEAVAWLRKERNKPFFMCLWHYAVHGPWMARRADVERFRDKIDPRGKQDNPVMAAMLKSLDQSVGRVLAALQETGQEENTIVVFASDNGGNEYSLVEGRTATNNDPLRAGKGSIYEGGVRTPAIVVWPGVVRRGGRCDGLVTSMDWYPTLLEAAGLDPLPAQHVDGVSIVPALRGGASPRQRVFCHFPYYVPATGNRPASSVREGRWKYYRFYGDSPELYDLATDLGETRNLIMDQPDTARRLDAALREHLERTGAVLPIPNPRHDPAADSPMTAEGKRQEGRVLVK